MLAGLVLGKIDDLNYVTSIAQDKNFQGCERKIEGVWSISFKCKLQARSLQGDGCRSKENLFEHSTLLMNAIYIAFP